MSHDDKHLPQGGPSYAVGYGRPPREHQFGPGNKAAAGSRRPKSLSQKDTFSRIMTEPVSVTKGGRRHRMPAFEALIRSLRQRALAGDDRAVDKLCKYWKLFGFDPGKTVGSDTTDYAAIVRARIDAMAARIQERRQLEEEQRRSSGSSADKAPPEFAPGS